MRGTESWLNCQAPSVVISTKSIWRTAPSGLPLELISTIIILNSLLQWHSDETQHTPREFAADAELAEVLIGWRVVPFRGKKRNGPTEIMKFNNGKHKVLTLGRNNPRQHHTLRPEKFEGSSEGKNLVTWWTPNWSQASNLPLPLADILGCTRISTATRTVSIKLSRLEGKENKFKPMWS